MNGIQYRSADSHVGTFWPAGEAPTNVQEIIQYWQQGILSDLAGVLHTQTPARQQAPTIAAAAHRWFRDAWQRDGRPDYQINLFEIRLWSERDGQGRLLAGIDVLTGACHLYC